MEIEVIGRFVPGDELGDVVRPRVVRRNGALADQLEAGPVLLLALEVGVELVASLLHERVGREVHLAVVGQHALAEKCRGRVIFAQLSVRVLRRERREAARACDAQERRQKQLLRDAAFRLSKRAERELRCA